MRGATVLLMNEERRRLAFLLFSAFEISDVGGSWYGISGECSDTFSLDAVGFEVYLKEGGGRISRYRINIMLEQIVLYPAYTIRVRLERYSTTLISTLTKIPQPGLLAVGYVTMTLSSIGHRVKKPLASSL